MSLNEMIIAYHIFYNFHELKILLLFSTLIAVSYDVLHT